MTAFFAANWGTMLVLLAVALIVFLAIHRMVKDKKNGIGACGQKCAHCAMHGKCEELRREAEKRA